MAYQAAALSKIEQHLTDWRWRLNHLYWITNKEGKEVQFKMNWAQEELFEEMHFLNVILKARQLGFSTFILLFMLDSCIFRRNIRCGLIDTSIDDAKSKLARIKWAWDRLPEWIKEWNPLVTENAYELQWANGSGISVGTSHRGGTLQILHISEFGKICAKFPDKAREIVTGALNTVQAGQLVFIESTAEGQEGRFYDICQQARALLRIGKKLTALDFKFFFFPWHRAPEYVLPADSVTIPAEMSRYFDKLNREHNIEITPEQRAWYVAKRQTQMDDMKREYPATPDEAFEASIEGAIFGPWVTKVEEQGRIGNFPAEPGVPVHTFWDIGRKDYTSIWFGQILTGPKVRLLGYYQNCMEGVPHYANVVKGMFEENGWIKGVDFFPHDARVVEWGSDRSRIEQLKEAGFNARLGVQLGLHDGINACRASLEFCEFDEAGTSDGLAILRRYRWEWNDKLGAWRTGTPAHDDASHGADAFRTLATSWREIVPAPPAKPEPPAPMTVMEIGATGVRTNVSMSDDPAENAKRFIESIKKSRKVA